VERALFQAHADVFVRQLPLGLETQVGERGQRLSGGQAQRIALARAFLKNAPVLVLDEPTAQLDPEHESAVRESMISLAAGRTVLLIAHRLTTVAAADAVAVLADGRVVECGTPRDLAAAGGRYATMLAAYGGVR
jgi:ATP-binding cassette subfamily C protein CydD